MMAQTAVLTLTKKGLIDNTTIEGKLCPVIETLCTSIDLLNSGISVSFYVSFFSFLSFPFFLLNLKFVAVTYTT